MAIPALYAIDKKIFMKLSLLLAFGCTITLNSIGQQNALVELSKLKSCEISIKINPLTSTPEINFIDSIKNIEIVWFVVGSKNVINLYMVQRVAVFQTEVKDGKEVVFLMPKNQVTGSGWKISGVYPNWSLISGLRFYKAACFYEMIKHL